MGRLLRNYFKHRSTDFDSDTFIEHRTALYERIAYWKNNPQSFLDAVIEIGVYKIERDIHASVKLLLEEPLNMCALNESHYTGSVSLAILEFLQMVKMNAIQIPDTILLNIYTQCKDLKFKLEKALWIDVELDNTNQKINDWIQMILSQIPASELKITDEFSMDIYGYNSTFGTSGLLFFIYIDRLDGSVYRIRMD